MPVTLLTNDDTQGIVNELEQIRYLMKEVGTNVGIIMQMRSDMENMISIVSDLNYNLSILFSTKQYKEFKKMKQLSLKKKKKTRV